MTPRKESLILHLLLSILVLVGSYSTQTASADKVDFDGDGYSDLAVWRPTEATWFVRPSLGVCPPQMQPYGEPGVCKLRFGQVGDIPFTSDFDQDGKSDFVVFRPKTATWYIRFSFSDVIVKIRWGNKGDLPDASDLSLNSFAEILALRKRDKDGNTKLLIRDYTFRDRIVVDMGPVASAVRNTLRPIPGQYGAGSYLQPAITYSSVVGPSKFTTVKWRRLYTFEPPVNGTLKVNQGELQSFTYGSPKENITFFADYGGTCCNIKDFASFAPGLGIWTITDGWQSTSITIFQLGAPGDTPVAGQFTDPGNSDVAVWRGVKGEWEGTWFIRPVNLSIPCPPNFISNDSGCYQKLGLAGDIPIDESSPRVLDRPNN